MRRPPMRQLLFLVVSFQALALCPALHAAPSPEVVAYIDQALGLMRENALFRDRVDWDALRRETIERAGDATTPPAAYEAIRFALRSLADDHSFLQLSRRLEAAERSARGADAAGSDAEHPEAADHDGATRGPSPFAKRMQPEGRILQRDGRAIAFVVMPQGRRDDYEAGRGEYEDANGKKRTFARVDGDPYSIAEPRPVAVLIDRGTASSGEAMAVAFRGRPHTRSFGERTYGASTATRGFALSDGANLVIAVSTFVDRNGVACAKGVEPDQPVATDDDATGDDATGDDATGGAKSDRTDRDAVLEAALDWLLSQEIPAAAK